MIDGIGSSSVKPVPLKKSGTGSGVSPTAKSPAKDEKNITPVVVMRPISEATAKKKDEDASTPPATKDTTKPPPNNSTVHLPQNQPDNDKKTKPVTTQTTTQKDTTQTLSSTSTVYLPLIQKRNDTIATPAIAQEPTQKTTENASTNKSTVYLPLIQAPSATASSSAVVLSGDKQGTQQKNDDAKTANSPTTPVVSSGASWPTDLSQWGLTTAPKLDTPHPMGPSLPTTPVIYGPQKPPTNPSLNTANTVAPISLSLTVPVINTGAPSLGMSSTLNTTSTLTSPILASSAPLVLAPATAESTEVTVNDENPTESIAAITTPSLNLLPSITASNTTATTATLGIPVASVNPKVTTSGAPENLPNTPPNSGGWGLSMGGGGGKYPLAMITSPIVTPYILSKALPAFSSAASTLWSNWFGPKPSATNASPAGPAAPDEPVSALTMVNNAIAAGEQAIDDAAHPAPETPGVMSTVLNAGWLWSHVSTGNLMPVINRVQTGITLNQQLQNPALSDEARAQLEKAQRLNLNPVQEEVNTAAQWWVNTKDAHPWVGQTQAWLDQRWVDTKEAFMTGMLMNTQAQMIETTGMMALTGVQTEAEAEAQIQTVQTQTEAEIAAQQAKYAAQRQAVAYQPEVTTTDAQVALNTSGQQAQVLAATVDQLTAQLQQQQQQLAAIPDPTVQAQLRTQMAQTQQQLTTAQQALRNSPLYNATVLTQQATDANEARGDVVGVTTTTVGVGACVIPGVNLVACAAVNGAGAAGGGQLVDEVNQTQGTTWEQAQKGFWNFTKGFGSTLVLGGLAKVSGSPITTVTGGTVAGSSFNTGVDLLAGKGEQAFDNFSPRYMAPQIAMGLALGWGFRKPTSVEEPATIPESHQLDVPGVLDFTKVTDPVTGKVSWEVPYTADPFTGNGTAGASPVTNSGASTALVPYGPQKPGPLLLTAPKVWPLFPGDGLAGGIPVSNWPMSPTGPTKGGSGYGTGPDPGSPWWNIPPAGNNPTGSGGAPPGPSNSGGGAPQMQTVASVDTVMVADTAGPQMQWTLTPWAVDPQLVGDFTPVNGSILPPVANPLQLEHWVVGVDPLLAGQAQLPALPPLPKTLVQPIRQPAALPASETLFGTEPTTVAAPMEKFIPTGPDWSNAQWMVQAQSQAQPQTNPVQAPVFYGPSPATQATKDADLAPPVEPVTTAPPVMVYDVLSSAPTTTTTAIADASSTNTATYRFPDIAVAQIATPVIIPTVSGPNLAKLTLPDWMTGRWSAPTSATAPQPAMATEPAIAAGMAVAVIPPVSVAPVNQPPTVQTVIPPVANPVTAPQVLPQAPAQSTPASANQVTPKKPATVSVPPQASIAPIANPVNNIGGGAPEVSVAVTPASVSTASSSLPNALTPQAPGQVTAPETASNSVVQASRPKPIANTMPAVTPPIWANPILSTLFDAPSAPNGMVTPVVADPMLSNEFAPAISLPLAEGTSPWQLNLLQLLIGKILIYLNEQLESLTPATANGPLGNNDVGGLGQGIIIPPTPPFAALPAWQAPIQPTWIPLPVPGSPVAAEPKIPFIVSPQITASAPVNLGSAPIFPNPRTPQGNGGSTNPPPSPINRVTPPATNLDDSFNNPIQPDDGALDGNNNPSANDASTSPKNRPNSPPSNGFPLPRPSLPGNPTPWFPNAPDLSPGRSPYTNPYSNNGPQVGSPSAPQPWPTGRPLAPPSVTKSPISDSAASQGRYRWLVANQQVTQTRWVQFHTMVKGPNGQIRRVTTLRKITDNTRSVRASGAPLA
jgi:hypothetical protein